jgi:hypothetical protein
MAEEKTEQAQEKAKSRKKINKLTLAEVEKKLKEIESTQGGYSSRYAQVLLKRRDILRAGKR